MVNPQQISSYIRKPYALDAEAEANLREIIKEYPYFSNAWLLLARSLHNQNHSNFDEVLKQASMYGGDRSLLYKLVNITAEEADEKIIPADNKVVAPPLTEAEQEVIATTTLAEEEPKGHLTETVEEEPAAQEEQDKDALLTEEEKLEEIKHDRGEPIEETDSYTQGGEQTEKADNQVVTSEGKDEEEKVKSTFEEIFSNADNNEGENNVSNEFETFDINENREEEPVLPNFDDDDEFVLQVEDNDESADIMADAIVTADDTKEEAVSENDSIRAKGENTGEGFEQSINEPEELVLASSNYTVSNESSEALTDNEEQQAHIVAEQEETQPEEPEQNEEVDEKETVDEAIAFKLNSQITEAAENTPEPKTSTNELMAPSTFFEWLTQLKNPQSETTGSSEKKNGITKKEQVIENEGNIAPESQAESSTSLSQKSSSVDDIIERFIQINPTISRPKTEFYNPEVKSKESDTERDDLATETLAKIYIQQNLNDKAVEIYNRLIKIHPEKEEEYKAAIAEIG